MNSNTNGQNILDDQSSADTTSVSRLTCPICNKLVNKLGSHIRKTHGEEALFSAVIQAKKQKIPDADIGRLYGVSIPQLDFIITQAFGANISNLARRKVIKKWQPPCFVEETSTVWSFKQRGDWVTHNGDYRGNWSPYIPRNIILKYSKPGDVVLDYFSGGGTTAVESKLLSRRCTAIDINEAAVEITRDNLKFKPISGLFDGEETAAYEPIVSVGDARSLSGITDSSIDLICTHPPYAGIIKYSTGLEGDLSSLPVNQFLVEMMKVANESLRVLKPGSKCAILIGDARKTKHVVPIGFETIRVFLDAGFILKELIIKRQHNCRATGYWYTSSVKHNFLLLAHEYLPIFEKPLTGNVIRENRGECSSNLELSQQEISSGDGRLLESTTVWRFAKSEMDESIRRNLLERYGESQNSYLEIGIGSEPSDEIESNRKDISVAHYKPNKDVSASWILKNYISTLQAQVQLVGQTYKQNGVLVIEAQDIRQDGLVVPMALLIWEMMRNNPDYSIKEIVVVVPENTDELRKPEHELVIVHRYLLIFTQHR